jgi:hypothetical protein
MNKHRSMALLVLGFFYLSTADIKAYVYGYTRFYRPDTQKTIDLVYDRHVSTENLSHDAMHNYLCDEIKQGLYRSEKVLVDSLEHLNQVHPHDTTVIWEHAGPQFYPKEVHLLSYPDRLVIGRLRNLKFVSSDTWRHEYPACIMSVLGGSSLHSRVNRNEIIENSGYEVWQKYQAAVKATQNRLVNTYSPHRELVARSKHNDDLYKDLFFARDPYSEIADLEMLSHILASSHRRIVLFAGGAHSERIANFLMENTSYELVHSVIDRHYTELDPTELKRIAVDHTQQHKSPGNYSRVTSQKPLKTPLRIPIRNKKRIENVNASRLMKEPLKSAFSNDKRKIMLLGGSLLLGGILVSAYYESQGTPGRAISSLVKQKIAFGLKYASIAAVVGYLYMKFSRAS